MPNMVAQGVSGGIFGSGLASPMSPNGGQVAGQNHGTVENGSQAAAPNPVVSNPNGTGNTNASSLQGYANTMSGQGLQSLQGGYNNALGSMQQALNYNQNTDSSQMLQAQQQLQNQQGAATQQAMNSGLGNSTVMQAMQQMPMQNYDINAANIQNQMAERQMSGLQSLGGLQAQAGTAIGGYQQGMGQSALQNYLAMLGGVEGSSQSAANVGASTQRSGGGVGGTIPDAFDQATAQQNAGTGGFGSGEYNTGGSASDYSGDPNLDYQGTGASLIQGGGYGPDLFNTPSSPPDPTDPNSPTYDPNLVGGNN